MDDLCSPLISRIMCSILGIDPRHFSLIRTFEKQFMKALVPSMTLESLSDIKSAHSSFRKMLIVGWEDGTLKQARLLHALLSDVQESERPIVMSHTEFILAGGIESSVMLLTESIFRLLTDLGKEAQMLKNEEERSFLIEELVRMSSPISVVTRKAGRDQEIGGHMIREGKILMLFLACVNRDPRYFPHPDEVSRENLKTPHLAFGLGRHHCMGSELSKMEMNFILPAFMERFGYKASIKPETIKKSFYTPGIASAQIQLAGKDHL
jgi:cytochrome P450